MTLKHFIASTTLVLGSVVSGYAQHNITSGGTYTFADGDAIAINTTQPVTLYHCTVTCDQPNIVTCEPGANITIEQSYFASNRSIAGEVINLTQPAQAIIVANHIEGGSDVGSFGIIITGPTSGALFIAQNAINNCMYGIRLIDVPNNPMVYVVWNQLTGDAQTPCSDQINISESSGIKGHLIYVHEDFVEGNPDVKNIPGGTDIQAGDTNTSYVLVDSCTVLNVSGIDIFNGNNNTSAINNCLALGIGDVHPKTYSSGISLGHSGDTQAGTVNNSQSGWWNTSQSEELNFLPTSWKNINGNSVIPKSGITLAAEQAAYQAWLTAAANAGVTIGDPRGGNPSPTWPSASDFNF